MSVLNLLAFQRSLWLGLIGVHLSMRFSNFPLNQTGLAWCAITCMIMPDNSNRITLQGCKLLWYPTRGLSMKYKVDALTVPRCRRKTVARKLSWAEIQWVTTPHFIFFLRWRTSWHQTSNITNSKYPPLHIGNMEFYTFPLKPSFWFEVLTPEVG